MPGEENKPQFIIGTFNYLGGTVTIKIAVPSNKELNAHIAGRLKIEDGEEMIRYRAAMFDRHIVECSRPKQDILDATKANIVLQLFENFTLDVKN